MHPIYGKFQRFQNFKKYPYSEISKPNQSLKEQFQSFSTIFLNSKFKSTYMKDLKYLKEKPSNEVSQATTLQNYYRLHQISDILIITYSVYSLFWHYKKGYFHIQTNKKLPLVDLYIVGKIVFNMILMSAASYFMLKKLSDPIMYKYYEKKEKEWEENSEKLLKEKIEIAQMQRKVK